MNLNCLSILSGLLLIASCARPEVDDGAADRPPRPHGDAESAATAPEPAFEWGAVFALPAGEVMLRLHPGAEDATMRVALIAVGGPTADDFDAVIDRARQAFDAAPVRLADQGPLPADGAAHQLQLAAVPMRLPIAVPVAGYYACFTEHLPWELDLALLAAGEVLAPLQVRQFHDQLVELGAVARKTSGIRVGKARLQRLDATITAPARVAFNQEAMAHVGSPLRGWVEELLVRLGDEVQAGQPLLVIVSPELGEAQSAFLLQRAAAAAAAPAVALAKDAHDRADALYQESKGLSLTEVQRREAEYRAAQSAQRGAEAAMAAAENRLRLLGMSESELQRLAASGVVSPRHTRLAPIAGNVVEREVTPGELVGPDQGVLLVLADMQTLWVLADVPEARVREVHLGAAAAITTVGAAAAAIEGVVSYIAPVVDLATRSVPVRIAVSGGTSGLRPGMFARVEIRAGGAADAAVVAISEDAVQWIDGQACVFVPGAAGVFTKRLVLIDEPIGGMVAVRSGLRQGEPVVTAGSFVLKAELGKAGAHHDH